MVARNETFFKWLLYAGAALAAALVQSALLGRLRFWGVMPFVYPAVVALVGMLEEPAPGAVFGLCLGIVCDCAMAGPIPCFYTLIFPLAALCASLIAKGWVAAGPVCTLLTTAAAFILTDLFHGLLLALSGRAAWMGVFLTLGKEFALTLPFALAFYPLFRAIFRRGHRDG